MKKQLLVTDTDWESAQGRLGGQLLQSAAWAKFQEAVGRPLYGRVVTDQASAQLFERREAGWHFLYAPYGPTFGQTPDLTLLNADFWEGSGADFLRVEPMGEVTGAQLREAGAIPSTELNPAHTITIDLTQPEEQLRAGLSAGHRSAVNAAERRGLSFRRGEETEVTVFLQFLHQTGNRRHFRPHPDEYYRQMLAVLGPLQVAGLYVAEREGSVIATAITLDYRGTRIYAHAATDPQARQWQAAVPLVWHMMTEAKQLGLKRFDLWGVAPLGALADHPWAGFSQFKRAFGGQEEEYLGTWDLPLRSLRYRLYQTARAINRTVRR